MLGNNKDISMAKNWGKKYWNFIIKEAKRKNKMPLEIFDEKQHSGKISADYVCKYINNQSIVLEIACGLGRVSRHVAPYCEKLYCTDMLKQSIDLAEKNLSEFKNIVFQRINGYDLKCFKDNLFDLVFSFGTFYHLDIEIVFNYFKEIKRVLKRDGVCIIEFQPLNKKTLEVLNEKIVQRGIVKFSSEPWKYRYFSKDWLKAFADYFNFVILNDDPWHLTVKFR